MVRIIVDRDEKGEAHGKVVAEAIATHVREVKIIHLSGLPPKGDLWDWIEAGGSCEQLKDIVEKTPAFGLPAACGKRPGRRRRKPGPTIHRAS